MANQAPNIKLTAFGLANYRSIGPEGFLLRVKPRLSALIGKNNSGKSNVLRAIQILSNATEGARTTLALLDRHGRRNGDHEGATGIIRISKNDLFRTSERGIDGYVADAMRALGDEIEVRWELRYPERASLPGVAQKLDAWTLHQVLKHLFGISYNTTPSADELRRVIGLNLVAQSLPKLGELLRSSIVIPERRHIANEQADEKEKDTWKFDGRRIIGRLRSMQEPLFGHEEEQERFLQIQSFAGDLLGDPNLTLRVLTDEDQLSVTTNGIRLPLENCGTGIHHLILLCGAVAIHKDATILLEEPELHLHPELQRRFLQFLAERTSNRCIFTTHSNVFLDAQNEVCAYHVRHDGKTSHVDEANATTDGRALLADLGYKPSDLLQSNGVIWVEGPSDRTYLKRWLELEAPELSEGLHFTIMFFGGCGSLAHLSGDPAEVDGLINLRSINPNAFVIVDSDRESPGHPLSDAIARLQAELGDACWVTEGREVENYLDSETVCRALGAIAPAGGITIGPYTDLIKDVLVPLPEFRWGKAKPKCALRIAPHITKANLSVLDLKQRLAGLIATIRTWNLSDRVVARP